MPFNEFIYGKTPLSWYGGKQNMLKHILPLLKTPHTHYAEVFAGGAAVFFAKQKVCIETLNDTNLGLMTFYEVAKHRMPELAYLIETTLHSRVQHDRAVRIYKEAEKHADKIELAWATWIKSNMTFMKDRVFAFHKSGESGSFSERFNNKCNALLETVPIEICPIELAWACWVLMHLTFMNGIDKGYAFSKSDSGAGIQVATGTHNSAKDVTATINARESIQRQENQIYKLAKRLENVQLERDDVLKIIKRYDHKDTLFYIDPPYYNSDCGHYKGYTEANFIELLNLLNTIKGKYLLSCYPNPHIEILKNVQIQSFDKNLSAGVSKNGEGKGRKTELLIYNYQPEISGNLFQA